MPGASEGELIEPRDFPPEFTRDYRIVRVIGSGAMGQVFEAIQQSLHRRVAVKVMRPGAFRDAAAAERFREEARILARLSHRNIVTLYDAGLAGEVPYIVTEYVEGDTLAQRIAKGPLGIPETVRVAMELLDGLEYLHANGVVHRDLKPENAFFLPDRGIKVIDFGLARAIEGRKALTEVGFAVGTPAFMSPEQILGQECLPAWDVYALGVILFRALTGNFPFPVRTTAEMIESKLRSEPTRLAAAMPAAPGWLQAAVDGALSRTSSERLATCAAMRHALAPGRQSSVWVPAARGRAIVAKVRGSVVRAIAAQPSGMARWAAGLTGFALLIAAGWTRMAPGPAAAPVPTGPRDLAIIPSAPGTHILSWNTDGHVESVVKFQGRTFLVEGARSRHAVPVKGMPEGQTVELQLGLPAGRTSQLLTTRVPRFHSAEPVLERGLDSAMLELETGVPCSLSGFVASATGVASPLEPGPTRTLHRVVIPGLDPQTDYAVTLQLSTPTARREIGPLTTPAPFRLFRRFHEEVRAADLDKLRDDIFHVRDRREPKAASAARIRARLDAVGYRPLLQKLSRLLESSSGGDSIPIELLSQLHDQFKELRKTDLFCEVLGIPFASGVEALELASYHLSGDSGLSGSPGRPVRQIDIEIGDRGKFQSRALEPWTLFGTLIQFKQNFAIDLSSTQLGSRAEIGLFASGLLPGAAFEVNVEPKRLQATMLFAHRVAGFPADAHSRWLYHTFDARCLRRGPTEIQVKFSTPVAEPKRMQAKLERLVVRIQD